ncbi:cytosine deaminase [Actinomadura sp. NBRC 104412]|uniref:cytosine deaminase n=1 Tax=Actinomadura sp. NBRC 104412 TaxID=3032203 RepID=UPI0024A18362|nr:cytosine deaminase [Actinomadura sp. NBRC 104412]GLZ03603.1 cytosine deaminase [Actinomadura sp. NBRC 104412]
MKLLRNARFLDRDGVHDIELDGTRIARIVPAGEGEGETLVDARGGLVTAPFVEPHVHLDTTLTAGEPRWNASGSLWEGIAVWSERKQTLTRDDVIARATEVLRWYAANGVLHVRSHVDVTDPSLTALDAMLEVRERVADVINLQLVAFPQEGIVSYENGAELLEEAARRGVDVIGAIPHFEDTREDGVRSLEIAFDIAERHGLLLDAHCDEIDDEQSRFVEVLATLARRTGLRDRATASHTTAMGSYNGAYSYKLQRILARSGINLVCNPIANLCLQGRFDAYPKRRGLTQVKEMLAVGVNVAFGHDDVMDPWSPLGTASSLQVALIGIVAAQLTGKAEMDEAFAMVTERAARVLRLGDAYGVAEGRPADLVVLPATSAYDAVRRQTRPTHVVSKGRLIAETPETATHLTWPGEPPREVTFTRPADRPRAPGT